MRFEASQSMKLGQQMKLAPRMIQSMEILQMALPALEERIEQELESNIALEIAEPGSADDFDPADAGPLPSDDLDNASRIDTQELNVEENGGADDFERLDTFESDYSEAFENEYSASSSSDLRAHDFEHQTYSASRMAGERDAKMDAMANAAARGKSLGEFLLEQWMFADVLEELREPGKALIASIDEDGYLRTPLETIRDHMPGSEQDKPSIETLERALTALQVFLEPAGIGARDTRECLLLQIDAIEEDEPGQDLTAVRTLVANHLDDLINNRMPKVARDSGLSIEQIKDAIEFMRRLVIHPGRMLASEPVEAVTVDAIVEYDEDNDRYYAFLTDGRLPNLQLNREYALLSRDRSLPKQDREFIKTNLSNAQWLIDAVRQRQQTLLRVINVVVEAQRDFFDLGPEALRPLPMTQVAEQLGMHVATVSRAVAGKHIQTPRGVFPLRRFFSGGTQTESGEDVSWDAIKAAMRDVVDNEDPKKPLSDEAIVKALKARGIEIARRTVAKYRAQLDIPPARMRRKY
jgi:RNA polymerase sigma-54 factor